MALGNLIAELPESEKPRERLLAHGGEALSETELLAVLLRVGAPGKSVAELAGELLAELGGLGGLATCEPHRLQRPGIGPAKSATLLAAVELGRRLARAELPERRPMSHPSKVASYLALRYALPDQEVMGALFVDSRNRLLGDREMFRGTIDRAAVEPRAVLKEALLRGASGILLFHTHPSGDPSPSVEDLVFTRRMVRAAEVMGLRLLDHLILASGGGWVSLRERGAW